jgi:hypothetical protein
MKLTNFSLATDLRTITLIGLGREWELHNYANFSGIIFSPEEDVLELRWVVPDAPNPWGCLHNHAKGCILRFQKLLLLRVVSCDIAASVADDVCLSGVSKVIPNTTDGRFKREWRDDEPFNLLFEFQSRRIIEIQAETAVLEALEDISPGG